MVALIQTQTNLLEDLKALSQEKATGELILSNGKLECKIHFVNGRLMYVQDNLHPVRRLKRALMAHDLTGFLASEDLEKKEIWQTELLYQAITKKQLHLIDVKKIITKIATECILELGHYDNLEKKWERKHKTELGFCQLLALCQTELTSHLAPSLKIKEEWNLDSLNNKINPSCVPVFQEVVKDKSLAAFKNYFNGKNTIWDIAQKLDKSITYLAKVITQLLNKGLITLKSVNDYSITDIFPKNTNSLPTKKVEKKRLIAIIDPNEIMGQRYQQLLGKDNYKIFNLLEPMAAIGKLIDLQPDLIFINLSLPNVDSYSLCRFLRQSPAFQTTPLFIVTENEKEVDLVRGKIFGATDFLVKSQAENTFANLIQQYA